MGKKVRERCTVDDVQQMTFNLDIVEYMKSNDKIIRGIILLKSTIRV